MLLILAAMMALTGIAGTIDTAPIDRETDTVQVIYKGNVILPIGDDPTDVWVTIYNDEEQPRLIAQGWCESDYTFSVGTPDGTRYVTDDVKIILTNCNSVNEPTRTHNVPDQWGSYTWYLYPSRWEHDSGTFNFTIWHL